MHNSITRRAVWVAFVALSLGAQAFAQESKDQDRKERITMHEQMARQHRNAAECLKAGKSVETCNQEAMKGCPVMKSGHCPFMNDMGMSHGGMMKEDSKKPESRSQGDSE